MNDMAIAPVSTVDAQEAIDRLYQLEIAVSDSRNSDILNKHWKYFKNRPADTQATYLFGFGSAIVTTAFAFYQVATNYNLSSGQVKMATVAGGGSGAVLSTTAYIYHTENEPEYQQIQKETAIDALQVKIESIYENDEILKDLFCPINFTMMKDPMMLPYAPTVLLSWKERQKEPSPPLYL